MVSGFDFDHAESGSLLDHGRHIVLFLPGVEIWNGHTGARGALHSDYPSLDARRCMPFRRQVPSGALSDYLETSNISTNSWEPPYPSYRFTLPQILIPVALRGRAAIVFIRVRLLIVHVGIMARGLHWAPTVHRWCQQVVRRKKEKESCDGGWPIWSRYSLLL